MKNGYRTVVRVILSILKILRFSRDACAPGHLFRVLRAYALIILISASLRTIVSYLRYAPNDFFLIHNS